MLWQMAVWAGGSDKKRRFQNLYHEKLLGLILARKELEYTHYEVSGTVKEKESFYDLLVSKSKDLYLLTEVFNVQMMMQMSI